MDIEFARTFLKVVDSGSFVGAAKSLHLTQAAVSRRIQTLESYLGCELFIRNKSGAFLTASGRRFLRHAASMVQTLERARHEVGVAQSFQGTLSIGGRFGLWSGLLLVWLNSLKQNSDDIQLRAYIGFEENLMQDLVDGILDIGVMYTPQNRPTLKVERLLEEDLVLVSTHASEQQMPNASTYVHVDWGPEFQTQLCSQLPEFSRPGIIVGIGWLALQHILSHGGSGYFPRRLVQDFITQKQLFIVTKAPRFELPAYVVSPSTPTNSLITPAIKTLRSMVASLN